ncbi:MAG: ATP-binding protein [Bellilinea sp.]
MSIRLRLTLLYTGILALTLMIFGAALYAILARSTLNAIKEDIVLSSDMLVSSIFRTYLSPSVQEPQNVPHTTIPFEILSGEQALKDLREREIVRILAMDGTLIASPFGTVDALPISETGMQTLNEKNIWWEVVAPENERLLVLNSPVSVNGEPVFIIQVARPLTERDGSLSALSTTLIIASLLTTLVAFGVGWALSKAALRPINRITQTASEIGGENDLTRRVDHQGPNDEVGRLAQTFNSMLSRLQEAYAQMNHALGMQRDFVADVSHELRTPLTTVRGNLDLLRRQPPLPEEERADILNDLVGESDRLIRLVNDLLILARADAGRNLLQEPVPLHLLVGEVTRQVRLLDTQREITETVEEVTALGDRDAVKQILLVLLDNALKHTPGSVNVAAKAADGQVELSVRDSGPGMPPELLGHIFDRFDRGETDANVPGFGLGLPIAKALAEGQGGAIQIESQVGMGTRVTVLLPLFIQQD